MLPDEPTMGLSPILASDVAGIDASLRAVAAEPAGDPSDPEVGYYAAELRNLRAAMLTRTEHGKS